MKGKTIIIRLSPLAQDAQGHPSFTFYLVCVSLISAPYWPWGPYNPRGECYVYIHTYMLESNAMAIKSKCDTLQQVYSTRLCHPLYLIKALEVLNVWILVFNCVSKLYPFKIKSVGIKLAFPLAYVPFKNSGSHYFENWYIKEKNQPVSSRSYMNCISE